MSNPTDAGHGGGGLGAGLTIGVTGHRATRLGRAAPQLTAAVAAVLGAIERLAPDAPLRLVSALADGGDTIASICAVARGWILGAVLPFAREVYAQDFAEPEGRDAYRRLLAASAAVIELDGPHDDVERGAAYERAGRLVLGQSDILLALWDGHAAQGRGGTGQVVAEAVAAGMPVIHVDPVAPAAPMLLWAGSTGHDCARLDAATVPRAPLAAALPGLIVALNRRPPSDACRLADRAG